MKLINHTHNPLQIFREYDIAPYHDVTLLCSNGTVLSSKVFLATVSPFFHAVFRNMDNDELDHTVSIIGYDCDIVHKVLALAATGFCDDFANQIQMECVLQLANNLSIHSIDVVNFKAHDEEMIEQSVNDKAESERIQENVLLEMRSDTKEETDDELSDETFPSEAQCNIEMEDMAQAKETFGFKGKTKEGATPRKRGFECKECDTKFDGEWPYLYHMTVHIGDKALECQHCQKMLTNQKMWKRHKYTIHNQRKEGTVCNFCGKVLASKFSLQQHMELHDDTKDFPFKCHICFKGFRIKGNLKRHQKKHQTRRDFICDVCGHTSKDANDLKCHKLTHQPESEKRHKCDLCDKSYWTKGNLVEHKRTHTTERAFACKECAKAFKTKHVLDVHVRKTHGAERFFCSLCGKTFKSRGDAQRHVIIHSDLKPFCCSVCGVGFQHSKQAERHFKAQHPNQKCRHYLKKSQELVDFVEKSVKEIPSRENENY